MNALLTTLIIATASPGEMKVHKDLFYTEGKLARQSLDVYAPAEGTDHPVVIWIHGGGWRIGDKARVQRKPEAFVERGFVFVSINYRFVPDVNVAEVTGDVAKAIHWVHENTAKYGGAADRIFVGGHSAGAHLAALVCTDESYLKAEGMLLSNIAGCFPVDTAAYDVPAQIAFLPRARQGTYTTAFGDNADSQREVSPITHVAKDKGIPPFLILYVASRRDSPARSEAFAKALTEAGVSATTVGGDNKTHATINRELGVPDDKPTLAVFQFLKQHAQD